MTTLLFANNASTTLAAGINDTATTATLASGTGALFPSPSAGEGFLMTFVDAATSLINEIVLVTARSGDTITIERGQEGTVPRSWLAGDLASNYDTAGTESAMVQANQFQQGYYDVAAVGGSANAITGVVNSPLTSIPNNMAVRFSAATANTGTVTFALTLGSTPTTAVNIVKFNNASLVAGDIPRSGYPVSLIYSTVLDAWVMVNPATSASGTGTVTGGANVSGTGVKVFLPAASTTTTLKFNTLVAGTNITLTDDAGGHVMINATGGVPPVTSVFGRTGDITAQPGDYTFAEISDIPTNVQELADLVISANSVLIANGSGALADLALAANTFLARASTGDISSKAVTDAALTLLASISGTTGTGGTVVLSASPTLVTPALGTPTALIATNATGTASGLTAGAATNVAGGAANQIVYQTASGVTGFVTAAAAGVLNWTGSAFTWVTAVLTSAANVFTNQQAVTPYRANISGAVSIDLSATAKSNTLILTLTGNVTSFALTNPVDGACYNIWLLENGTGGFTFSGLNSAFKFGGGAGTTGFVTTANARNLISATYGATEAVYLCGFTPGLS